MKNMVLVSQADFVGIFLFVALIMLYVSRCVYKKHLQLGTKFPTAKKYMKKAYSILQPQWFDIMLLPVNKLIENIVVGNVKLQTTLFIAIGYFIWKMCKKHNIQSSVTDGIFAQKGKYEEVEYLLTILYYGIVIVKKFIVG